MKKRSDEKTDEKMTGGDAASVREHVLSPEEYLSQIEFLDDDFEFQHKDGFEHVDTNFASQSYWKEAIARFKKNKGAMFSFVCILFLIVMALVGPHMNQFTYDQQIITNQNMAPRVPGLENMGILDGSETIRTSTGSKEINYYESNSLTDTYYWFGSDSLGRRPLDQDLERNADQPLCSGSGGIHRPCVCLTYGLVSGYFGGKVDMIMQRIVEILNSIPYLITVTLLLLVMKPGLMSITFALMFSGWLGMSRIARAEVLKLKEQEYVLASRTLGAKSFRIIFKEILPNIFGPLITQTMFSIPHAIFTEAFLAFIGLGVPEPMASLGSLISSGYQNFTSHPYMIVFPLIVMGLLMLCFNMLADGLRDALDPKMKDM